MITLKCGVSGKNMVESERNDKGKVHENVLSTT